MQAAARVIAALRRPAAKAASADTPAAADVPVSDAFVATLARLASTLGFEAAEVRGVLDDTHKAAAAQSAAVQALARQLAAVLRSQADIGGETELGLQTAARVGDAVEAVAAEVAGIVETLRQVAEAAAQITQIALQTRLVAFNASVEAHRAGDAGRSFGVVADAVKDLAGKVEGSSKDIMGTVGRLDSRIAALAREISRPDGAAGAAARGAVHEALGAMAEGVRRIHAASRSSQQVCAALDGQIRAIDGETRRTAGATSAALARTETLLGISERLLESVAECGIETEDTPYIRAAQEAAREIGQLLDRAVADGAITERDLYDENYQALAGSAPAQHETRFVALADRAFPAVQERLLGLSEKVVFCIAADRNGYIACHNRKYNQRQRPGDLAWNTANCRNRRIFNDRTGLASARNQQPFLLQTYRRDMGGGVFVVMKEAAAPITACGRHWGGLRLAFKF